MNHTNRTPISEAMRHFGYEDVREYAQPFEKRVYSTDRTDLTTNGYDEWFSERIDLIAGGKKWPGGDKVNLAVQKLLFGGKNSQFHELDKKHPETNCHSWRKELTLCAVMDVFYDTKDEEAVNFVKEYTKINDSCIGKSGTYF